MYDLGALRPQVKEESVITCEALSVTSKQITVREEGTQAEPMHFYIDVPTAKIPSGAFSTSPVKADSFDFRR
jgi:hypothetical protein